VKQECLAVVGRKRQTVQTARLLVECSKNGGTTGNERRPAVDRRYGGMCSCSVNDDRRRRRSGRLDTGTSWLGYGGDTTIRQYSVEVTNHQTYCPNFDCTIYVTISALTSWILTLQHVAIGIVSDREEMRWRFVPAFALIQQYDVLVVDRQTTIRVDGDTEQSRVRLATASWVSLTSLHSNYCLK